MPASINGWPEDKGFFLIKRTRCVSGIGLWPRRLNENISGLSVKSAATETTVQTSV